MPAIRSDTSDSIVVLIVLLIPNLICCNNPISIKLVGRQVCLLSLENGITPEVGMNWGLRGMYSQIPFYVKGAWFCWFGRGRLLGSFTWAAIWCYTWNCANWDDSKSLQSMHFPGSLMTLRKEVEMWPRMSRSHQLGPEKSDGNAMIHIYRTWKQFRSISSKGNALSVAIVMSVHLCNGQNERTKQPAPARNVCWSHSRQIFTYLPWNQL